MANVKICTVYIQGVHEVFVRFENLMEKRTLSHLAVSVYIIIEVL